VALYGEDPALEGGTRRQPGSVQGTGDGSSPARERPMPERSGRRALCSHSQVNSRYVGCSVQSLLLPASELELLPNSTPRHSERLGLCEPPCPRHRRAGSGPATLPAIPRHRLDTGGEGATRRWFAGCAQYAASNGKRRPCRAAQQSCISMVGPARRVASAFAWIAVPCHPVG